MTNTNIITARPVVPTAYSQLIQPVSVSIPFSGFYETCIAAELNQAIESAIEWENEQNGTSLTSEDYEINWRAMYRDTARAIADFYPDYIFSRTGVWISCLYDSMNSPVEYNFYNDSIICNIPRHDLYKLLSWLETNHPGFFREYVKCRFSPCSGWAPLYPADLDQWGHEDSWDDAQLSVILEAVDKAANGEYPDYYITLEGEYWDRVSGDFDPWQYMTRRESDDMEA